ncbi:MAG TPA: MOSC N-terminal beta barrel domain-containing protein [Candidatus Tumulicola sp.]|jgi:hypothetical protein
MLVGTVASIWRYPVKSLSGERLRDAVVDAAGIPGDRRSALFVRAGHARTGNTYRGKEHERLHTLHAAQEAVAIAAERGIALEAVAGEHFFDAAPLSIVVDRWLEDVSEHVGFQVEPGRFRPNIFVRASEAFTDAEKTLTGALLQIGSLQLRVRGPITRCVTITYAPDGASAQREVLRYIAKARNAWMGIYCDVVRAGSLADSDEVRTLPE